MVKFFFRLFLWLLISNNHKAFAERYDISKVRIDLFANNMMDNVIITNKSKKTLYMSASPGLQWEKDINAKDIFKTTNNLIVSPSFIKIPPNRYQVVRIGIRKFEQHKETAYRVYLKDITAKHEAPLGIRIYANPIDLAVLSVQFKLKPTNFNNLLLRIINTGNIHVRVNKIFLLDAQTDKVILKIEPKTLVIIFPKSYQQFLLNNIPAIYAGNKVYKINLITDRENIEKNALLEPKWDSFMTAFSSVKK